MIPYVLTCSRWLECVIFSCDLKTFRILGQILRETITYLFNIHIHVNNNILNTWNPKISSAWEIGESYLENINKAVIPVQILYLSTGDTVAHFKTFVIRSCKQSCKLGTSAFIPCIKRLIM